jgi:hypothetical protein
MIRVSRHAQADSQLNQQALREEADRLYDQYGKPLEAEHYGKFIAISSDGRTILGESILEVGQAARAAFGPGSFVFKLGPRAVGRWL